MLAAVSTPEQLAEALGTAAGRKQTITLGGRFSKNRMAGPVHPSDITISTASLTRVLQYEPRDLTISVEAGITYRELNRVLAEHRQMVPLDPPFSDNATIGGVLASNSSGPRRRLYGTARDLVIGMKFATLDGKLVQSGGMVVKNVAGLDMGKLMIGSFGTLAAMAVVNFKLLPQPAVERSFWLSYEKLEQAIEARNVVLKSALQPAAVDLLNPLAAAHFERQGYVLAIRAGGNAAVIDRYARELRAVGDAIALDGEAQSVFWEGVQNFTPRFLENCSQGAVVRISCTLSQIKEVVASLDVPALVRAGSGVCYAYFEDMRRGSEWMSAGPGGQWNSIMEFAPAEEKSRLTLWPRPGDDFPMMQRVKQMFDPHNLLNRGRLYGRI